MTYDLRHQPWLLALTRGGTRVRLGLQDALLQAHNLARVEDRSPLVEVALYRLLLAVLYRSLGGPATLSEAVRLWKAGRFPEERVAGYLDAWADRFDLFGPDRPFLQISGFTIEDAKRSPVSRLAPERSSGHNKTLFDHSFDAAPPPLTPGETARLLVGHQTFAVQGGKSPDGYLQDGPVARAAVVLVEGENLFETLLLNLVPRAAELLARDLPFWEWSDLSAVGAPVGPVQLYAWPSRRVRLHPDGHEASPVVRFVSYSAGWTVRNAPEDQMFAYRDDPRDGPQPVRIKADRGFWRDYRALVAGQDRPGVRSPRVVEHAHQLLEAAGIQVGALRSSIFGQAGHQGKVEAWRREHYPIPVRLFDFDAPRFFDVLQEGLTQADAVGEKCVRAGGRTLAAALLTTSDRRPDPRAVRALYGSLPIEMAYWSYLEERFTDLLDWIETATDDGSEAMTLWRDVVRHAVGQAFDLSERTLALDGRSIRAVAASRRVWQVALARNLGVSGGGVT